MFIPEGSDSKERGEARGGLGGERRGREWGSQSAPLIIVSFGRKGMNLIEGIKATPPPKRNLEWREGGTGLEKEWSFFWDLCEGRLWKSKRRFKKKKERF